MDSWYVVYTQPRAEDRALWHLRNQGFDCFLPRCLKTRRHARKTDTVLEPLFPRYLFTRFDADATRWRAINGSRGVVNLLCDGIRPLAVPGGLIDKLLANADADGLTSLNALGFFQKGSRVQVKAGPFAGQVGEVTDVLDRGIDRVKILLTMLGVETSLELPTYALDTA